MAATHAGECRRAFLGRGRVRRRGCRRSRELPGGIDRQARKARALAKTCSDLTPAFASPRPKSKSSRNLASTSQVRSQPPISLQRWNRGCMVSPRRVPICSAKLPQNAPRANVFGSRLSNAEAASSRPWRLYAKDVVEAGYVRALVSMPLISSARRGACPQRLASFPSGG